MIRKITMGLMVLTLLFVITTISFGNYSLVGNAVAIQCDDSDLREENDLIADTLFSRQVYSTVNYNVRGTTTGLHAQFKTLVTMKDSCISETKIKEFYCNVKKNVVTSTEADCPQNSRCYQGACVPLTCEDNDGFNIKQNSTISYSSAEGIVNVVGADYCESSTKIVEFVCGGEDVSWPNGVQNVYQYPHTLAQAVHLSCPTGLVCEKGACVKNS